MNKVKKYYIIWVILVVIIIAILTTFGFIYKNKTKKYRDLEEKIVEVSKKYVEAKFLYPEKGENIKVNLNDLKDNNLIDDFSVDSKPCDGYAVISIENTVYNYKGYIKCDNYTTKGY